MASLVVMLVVAMTVCAPNAHLDRNNMTRCQRHGSNVMSSRQMEVPPRGYRGKFYRHDTKPTTVATMRGQRNDSGQIPSFGRDEEPPSRGAIVRVDLPPSQKLIALTVDLCAIRNQASRYDGEYFRTLRGLGIPYTVYVSGKWMREHPEQMTEFMQDFYVTIGIHGDTHQALTLVTDPASVRKEFDQPIADYGKLLAGLEHDGKALRADGDRHRPSPDQYASTLGIY